MHSIRRNTTDVGVRSIRSRNSDDSQSTASYSSSSTRPSLHHAQTDRPIFSEKYDLSPATTYSSYYPRSSAETYKSAASAEELSEEPESYDPDFDVPEYRVNSGPEINLRPSTPSDFADFFPSNRRLYIRHDDTTWDGNMNLRVDTEDPYSPHKAHIQLFHMKLQDLKKREFSLRRYERASGREVCHSSRKYASEQRPGLTRSMSSAFASMRKPDFKRTPSIISTKSSKSTKEVRRQDSGYDSFSEDDELADFMAPSKPKGEQTPTNTLKLEFSNYAQVEVTRKGTKANKRYEFEYWGNVYTWRRVVQKDGAGKVVSWHLFKDDLQVAHIVPEMRSPRQVEEERRMGGWVPPCSMWISERSVLEAVTDVADVIVATGLMALADDSIKSHFSPPKRNQVAIPLTQMKLDFVPPRVMVEHLFRRQNSYNSTRSSPLRRESSGVY